MNWISKLIRAQHSLGDGFECKCCGQWIEGMPFSYKFPYPAQWYDIPETDRDKRCRLGEDTCVIDEEFFYIMGNVEMKVRETGQLFAWTVWISLSRDDFERAKALWQNPGRVQEPPYFGWLSTFLPCYPNTLNLKTNVHSREVGVRPYIEMEPTDHPLAVEQREGVTVERVREFAATLLTHHSNQNVQL